MTIDHRVMLKAINDVAPSPRIVCARILCFIA